MYVKDLPEYIKEVVILRTKQYGISKDLSNEDMLERKLDEFFVFELAPERYSIWRSVSNGDFASFY